MLRPWSRLFADRLRIFVHPDRLLLLRVRRGLKPVIIAQYQVMLGDVSHSEPWQPALAALRQVLAEKAWQGLVPTVVISNHFARYAVIPWNADLAGASEKQAFLRHSFQLAYGDPSKQWDLRMSKAGFGQPALASGIPHELLAGLDSLLEEAGMRADAIVPHLMIAANLAARQARQQSLCLVAVETGRVCIALIEHGAWRTVRNLLLDEADIQLQVPALIRRESIVHGLDTSGWPVFCHWPESENAEALALGDHPVSALRSEPWPVNFNHHAYRLAMWHE